MKWSPVAFNMYQRPRRTPKMSLKWTLAKGTHNAPQHHRTPACECVTKVACMTHKVISNRCHSSADKLWRRHYRKWGLTGLYSSCHLRWTWREHENDIVSLQISIIRFDVTISPGVRKKRREEGTISDHSVSFRDDISHGQPLTEKPKAENSLSDAGFGERDWAPAVTLRTPLSPRASC